MQAAEPALSGVVAAAEVAVERTRRTQTDATVCRSTGVPTLPRLAGTSTSALAIGKLAALFSNASISMRFVHHRHDLNSLHFCKNTAISGDSKTPLSTS